MDGQCIDLVYITDCVQTGADRACLSFQANASKRRKTLNSNRGRQGSLSFFKQTHLGEGKLWFQTGASPACPACCGRSEYHLSMVMDCALTPTSRIVSACYLTLGERARECRRRDASHHHSGHENERGTILLQWTCGEVTGKVRLAVIAIDLNVSQLKTDGRSLSEMKEAAATLGSFLNV